MTESPKPRREETGPFCDNNFLAKTERYAIKFLLTELKPTSQGAGRETPNDPR
jgi:hypothetical protein